MTIFFCVCATEILTRKLAWSWSFHWSHVDNVETNTCICLCDGVLKFLPWCVGRRRSAKNLVNNRTYLLSGEIYFKFIRDSYWGCSPRDRLPGYFFAYTYLYDMLGCVCSSQYGLYAICGRLHLNLVVMFVLLRHAVPVCSNDVILLFLQCILEQSVLWKFNAFTLENVTGGNYYC